MSYIIKELSTVKEMLEQIDIIRFLNPKETKEEYQKMLDEMLPLGYGQVGIYEKEKCIGISGFWINTKLYSGKYLEMDNVVVHENYRSKGIGKLLCDWCIQKAKENNCKHIMLDAYLENEKAHKFYEREGFIKKGYHFMKTI